MSTITVVAITVNAVTGVATTVGPMVTLIGTTLILIIILIFILIIILILSTALVVGVVGVGKGVTIVVAKAQIDCAGTSRHGFGALRGGRRGDFFELCLVGLGEPMGTGAILVKEGSSESLCRFASVTKPLREAREVSERERSVTKR
jgi:hypothetical protein